MCRIPPELYQNASDLSSRRSTAKAAQLGPRQMPNGGSHFPLPISLRHLDWYTCQKPVAPGPCVFTSHRLRVNTRRRTITIPRGGRMDRIDAMKVFVTA